MNIVYSDSAVAIILWEWW